MLYFPYAILHRSPNPLRAQKGLLPLLVITTVVLPPNGNP